MNKDSWNFLRAAGLASALFVHGPTLATEGGGNSYPLGVNTSFVGLMAREGSTAYFYFSHYAADKTKDNAGNDNPRLADFRLRSNVGSVRYSYVWPGVRVFGAKVETRVAVPWANVDLNLTARTPGGLVTQSASRTSLADPLFAPVLLGWHGKQVHQVAGVETVLPLGAYDKQRLVNTGRNYLSVGPVYSITWLPTPDIEVSGKFGYWINTKNQDTGYRSGREATLEYNLGYRLSSTLNLHAGINGYVYKQVSDDLLDHRVVNGDGNRGRVYAVGPFVFMQPTKTTGVLLKWQHEVSAVNRAEGNKLWLQVFTHL